MQGSLLGKQDQQSNSPQINKTKNQDEDTPKSDQIQNLGLPPYKKQEMNELNITQNKNIVKFNEYRIDFMKQFRKNINDNFPVFFREQQQHNSDILKILQQINVNLVLKKKDFENQYQNFKAKQKDQLDIQILQKSLEEADNRLATKRASQANIKLKLIDLQNQRQQKHDQIQYDKLSEIDLPSENTHIYYFYYWTVVGLRGYKNFDACLENKKNFGCFGGASQVNADTKFRLIRKKIFENEKVQLKTSLESIKPVELSEAISMVNRELIEAQKDLLKFIQNLDAKFQVRLIIDIIDIVEQIKTNTKKDQELDQEIPRLDTDQAKKRKELDKIKEELENLNQQNEKILNQIKKIDELIKKTTDYQNFCKKYVAGENQNLFREIDTKIKQDDILMENLLLQDSDALLKQIKNQEQSENISNPIINEDQEQPQNEEVPSEQDKKTDNLLKSQITNKQESSYQFLLDLFQELDQDQPKPTIDLSKDRKDLLEQEKNFKKYVDDHLKKNKMFSSLMLFQDANKKK